MNPWKCFTLKKATNPIFLFLISSFIFPAYLLAQKQTNYWYFYNNAGLYFKNGVSQALKDGALEVPPSGNAVEGSAAISDTTGNLLFYTNGMSVWNKHHQLMPNGVGLTGHWSATQSALIIPKPLSPNLYYLFTVDELSNIAPPNEGLRYSLVDMSLQDGNGDVIPSKKNVLLFAQSSEKLTAVKHTNGKDIWIISHHYSTNQFYVFLLDENKIHAPVISSAGSSFSIQADNVGYLKASPDGLTLANAMYGHGVVEIFSFNASNGMVSEPKSIITKELEGVYGVEFSPNGKLLYVSAGGVRLEGPPVRIYQFNLKAESVESMLDARVELVSYPVSYYDFLSAGALQLGLDGKIYFTKTNNYLDVIEAPNILGIGCKFMPNNLYLESKEASFGLPNFFPFFFLECDNLTLDLGRDTTLCYGANFTINPQLPIATYLWSDGSTAPSLTIKEPGIYYVKATVLDCTWYDTIQVNYLSKLPVNLGPDISLCKGEKKILKTGISDALYTWSNGSKQDQLTVSKAGAYWVEVIKNGCWARDTITVKEVKELHFSIGNDTLLCEGESLLLTVPLLEVSYLWNDGSTKANLQIDKEGIYSVEVSNMCETILKSITVSYENCNCNLELPNVFTPNNDGANDYFNISIHKNIKSYKLDIYNRWGKKIYENNDPTLYWSGEGSSSGLYFYQLNYQCLENNRVINKIKKGSISLLR